MSVRPCLPMAAQDTRSERTGVPLWRTPMGYRTGATEGREGSRRKGLPAGLVHASLRELRSDLDEVMRPHRGAPQNWSDARQRPVPTL